MYTDAREPREVLVKFTSGDVVIPGFVTYFWVERDEAPSLRGQPTGVVDADKTGRK
ncbi:MAG: hypothetical protein ACYDDF_08840 [Thermoplasmatota archaeon]